MKIHEALVSDDPDARRKAREVVFGSRVEFPSNPDLKTKDNKRSIGLARAMICLVLLGALFLGCRQHFVNRSHRQLTEIGKESSLAAIFMEDPTRLRERTKAILHSLAQIDGSYFENRSVRNAVSGQLYILDAIAEQNESVKNISRFAPIFKNCLNEQYGKHTADLFVLAALGESFMQLEYGVDQSAARSEYTRRSLTASLSCLKVLDPDLFDPGSEIGEELQKLVDALRIVQETENEVVNQDILDFVTAKRSAHTLTDSFSSTFVRSYMKCRALICVAVALHKMSDRKVTLELNKRNESGTAKLSQGHIVNSVWQYLFGTIEERKGGLFLTLEKLTERDKSQVQDGNSIAQLTPLYVEILRSRALNGVAVRQIAVDPESALVNEILDEAKRLTEGKDRYMFALSLSNEADRYLLLRLRSASSAVTYDPDEALPAEIKLRRQSIRELELYLSDNGRSFGAMRNLLQNYRRLGLAYFFSNRFSAAAEAIQAGHAINRWDLKKSRDGLTALLGKNVQASRIEGLQVVSIAHVANVALYSEEQIREQMQYFVALNLFPERIQLAPISNEVRAIRRNQINDFLDLLEDISERPEKVKWLRSVVDGEQ